MRGKRFLSILLALLLAMSAALPLYASAEDIDEEAYVPSAAEIALEGRPAKEEILHITVGNNNKVSGNFFSRQFGNNTSDIDVRAMIHGYNPIVWSSQLEFISDPQVVKKVDKTSKGKNTLYTITLVDNLYYNDGTTKITAEDYVFSLLLQNSPVITELGGDTGAYIHVVGWEEYASGTADTFAGVRLIDEYTFSVEVKEEFEPYFYEMSYLSIQPYPISEIAPGCVVKDSENGAYIDNEKKGKKIFTAELLKQTILDPETGYMSHPVLTCGPYKLVSYDRESGTVEFVINEYFKGNYEGVKPYIDEITLVPVNTATMIDQLESGELDLINKCVDGTVITDALARQMENINTYNYARMGYGYLALACEKGPQQFQAVRQAIAYCFDSDKFVEEFLMSLGIPVYGYYGIGQWMNMAAAGSLRPEELTEQEEEEWDALSLDNLNPYTYDLDAANKLLDEDGWVLNQKGNEYNPSKDKVRYKQLEDGTLMKLSFTFLQTSESAGSAKAAAMLSESFAQIGAELIVVEANFQELLKSWYREDGVRNFDIAFMGTNFVSTFDPYMSFSEKMDDNGNINTFGMVDDELVRLAWEMHTTEPMDLLGYVYRWIEFQKWYNEILPTVPIYSNIYFDFASDWLQNYSIGSQTNWPEAILYAYWAEPVEEEESDFDFDENTIDFGEENSDEETIINE